ncbi:MAG: peptidoglycan/xylan/chitin deacetylase (PgdA/CDA1 family) [Polaribacter sp.]|jgi:peptidoglycan/xylan/chitin deacetylase (PgdA/CDA1 family)
MSKLFKKIVVKLQQLAIEIMDVSAYLHKKRGYNQVSILTYHNIVQGKLPVNDVCFLDLTLFEQQISYLSKHFQVLSLADAFEQAKKKNSKPIAAITFDDGFYSNYALAFPILKKYNTPATIFLTTSMIDSNKTIWFCDLVQMLSLTSKKSFIWNAIEFDLSNADKKQLASRRLQKLLKEKPQASLIVSLSEISQLLECKTEINYQEGSAFYMLTQQAINEMLGSKLIEFGAHTHNHIILTKEDIRLAENEIIHSIKQVEKITQKDCRYFAYPNGRAIDFNEHHTEILRQNNIKLSATTTSGLTSPDENRLAFKRIFIHTNTSLPTFKLQVHGYR